MGSALSSEDEDIDDIQRTYSLNSTKALSDLDQLEKSYLIYEKEVNSIEEAIKENTHIKSLDNEEKRLKSIISAINKFQEDQVDAITSANLITGKNEVKQKRRSLNDKVILLNDKCQKFLMDCKKVKIPVLSKSYSYQSSNTMSKLEDFEKEFSTLKKKYEIIVELYLQDEIDDLSVLKNAIQEFENLIILLDKLQFEKIDSILSENLISAKSDVRLRRQNINKEINSLRDDCIDILSSWLLKIKIIEPKEKVDEQDNEVNTLEEEKDVLIETKKRKSIEKKPIINESQVEKNQSRITLENCKKLESEKIKQASKDRAEEILNKSKKKVKK